MGEGGELITLVGSIVLTFVVDNSLEIRVRDPQQVFSSLFCWNRKPREVFTLSSLGLVTENQPALPGAYLAGKEFWPVSMKCTFLLHVFLAPVDPLLRLGPIDI